MSETSRSSGSGSFADVLRSPGYWWEVGLAAAGVTLAALRERRRRDRTDVEPDDRGSADLGVSAMWLDALLGMNPGSGQVSGRDVDALRDLVTAFSRAAREAYDAWARRVEPGVVLSDEQLAYALYAAIVHDGTGLGALFVGQGMSPARAKVLGGLLGDAMRANAILSSLAREIQEAVAAFQASGSGPPDGRTG